MADVYEMPVPRPPDDDELDLLDSAAESHLTSTLVSASGRQTIRLQRHAIRTLRVALAQAQARAESVQAVANMRRDMEVAAYTIDQMTSDCPGVGTPPEELEYVDEELTDARQARRKPQADRGRCSICDAYVDLDGEVIGEHTFAPDPPVRPARPAG